MNGWVPFCLTPEYFCRTSTSPFCWISDLSNSLSFVLTLCNFTIKWGKKFQFLPVFPNNIQDQVEEHPGNMKKEKKHTNWFSTLNLKIHVNTHYCTYIVQKSFLKLDTNEYLTSVVVETCSSETETWPPETETRPRLWESKTKTRPPRPRPWTSKIKTETFKCKSCVVTWPEDYVHTRLLAPAYFEPCLLVTLPHPRTSVPFLSQLLITFFHLNPILSFSFPGADPEFSMGGCKHF